MNVGMLIASTLAMLEAPPFMDSEQVNARICTQLKYLATAAYGWGEPDSLPLRPDVRDLITDYLCRDWGHLQFPGSIEPAVLLDHRGGVTIRFANPASHRRVDIVVPCKGVVLINLEVEDGSCKISTRPQVHNPQELRLSVAEAHEWLYQEEAP